MSTNDLFLMSGVWEGGGTGKEGKGVLPAKNQGLLFHYKYSSLKPEGRILTLSNLLVYGQCNMQYQWKIQVNRIYLLSKRI